MSTPNPTLPLLLDGCRTVPETCTERWNNIITSCAYQIAEDRYDNRGSPYERHNCTVAAMICTDHLLRDAMLNAKINLEQFDNIVEAAKSIMYERTQEKNPAAKVVNVLNRILEG